MMNRTIILGASNVSLGFPIVCKLLHHYTDLPLEIYTACGHGRSYGQWSKFLFRGLPGILQCELWKMLEHQEKQKQASEYNAVLTDIGNDLIYGIRVDVILQWIEDCMEQLQQYKARITVTELPVGALLKLSTLRYEMTRKIFFKGRSLCWDEMRDRILVLNEGLLNLSAQYNVNVIKPSDEWYGFDPIHIKKSSRLQAWNTILGSHSDQKIRKMSHLSNLPARSLKRTGRAERLIFQKFKRTYQPVYQSDQFTLYSY